MKLRIHVAVFIGICSCLSVVESTSHAQDTIQLNDGLVISTVGQYGRRPFHSDLIEAARVAGKWKAPKAGDEIKVSDKITKKWAKLKAGSSGWFLNQALRGGYLYCLVQSSQDRIMLFEARGHSSVVINDRPYPGDPYNHGWISLPVKLKKGTNDFLFHVGRGKVWARLVAPKKSISLGHRDLTMPDLIVSEQGPYWGAVLVKNATGKTQSGLSIVAKRKGAKPIVTSLDDIPPMTNRKVAFKIAGPITKTSAGELVIELTGSVNKKKQSLDSHKVNLSVKSINELHRRTFRSKLDGSVQYYAVRPAANPKAKSGLVLSLHGASVEGQRQASVYTAKESLHIVSPTNRRPYGFDWEDWGRADAMEVLADAQKRYQKDLSRTYLTGHSMGGHGTWHLGAMYPDRFAAIGPSAGWISFWTYGGVRRNKDPKPVEKMFIRPMLASDTLKFAPNYSGLGVYVLHGSSDTNVPVTQARGMRQMLSTFHPDFVYKEQTGAGHWWGNQCCDWKPMFEFFAHHRLPAPEKVDQVQFRTANPGISSRSHWASVEGQEKHDQISKIDLKLNRKMRLFSGKTENVSKLSLTAASVKPDIKLPGTFKIDIDGTKLANIAWPGDGEKISLLKKEGKWTHIEKPSLETKGAHRQGPFKSVFNNRVLLVYGTRGTAEENRWSLNKARYDAEQLWYRGNGSVQVIADTKFNLSTTKDRNVILYGNSDTNAAWYFLLEDSPVQVSRSVIIIGSRQLRGPSNATIFIRPRPDSKTALVGVVGGTSVQACRATTKLPYFVSGIGYPDAVIFGSDIHTKGLDAVKAAGYFGNDWSVRHGDFFIK